MDLNQVRAICEAAMREWIVGEGKDVQTALPVLDWGTRPGEAVALLEVEIHR